MVRCVGGDAVSEEIEQNKWYKVKFIWDGSNLSLYVNDKQISQKKSNFTPSFSANNLIIGQYSNPENIYQFYGMIRNLKIFDVAIE